MMWNIQMDKLKSELRKNRIDFKEIQGAVIISPKTNLYEQLEIEINEVHICKFGKFNQKMQRSEMIIKEFIYLAPLIKYIKKYLKGEL